MTTVGYGDIIPHTTLGRIVAMVVMLVGIAFIAILTAALAERLVRRRVTEETAAVALDVDEAEATVLLEIGEIAERLRILEARLSTRARRAP
jgi:voltage-gated potassium channel